MLRNFVNWVLDSVFILVVVMLLFLKSSNVGILWILYLGGVLLFLLIFNLLIVNLLLNLVVIFFKIGVIILYGLYYLV